MAATPGSGKKSKKMKGKTLNLTEFLAEGGDGKVTSMITPRKNNDWADKDDSRGYEAGRIQPTIDTSMLPTAPKAARALASIDRNKLPSKPPYTAFLANLPYDVSESDVEEFFKDSKVVSVRLPKGATDGRPRGFGYTEFENLESLVNALSLNDQLMKNRRIRVDVAGGKIEQDRGDIGERFSRGSNYDRGDRFDRSDRTDTNNWRRAGPVADDFKPSERTEYSNNHTNSWSSGGFGGNRYDDGGSGGSRGRDEHFSSNRRHDNEFSGRGRRNYDRGNFSSNRPSRYDNEEGGRRHYDRDGGFERPSRFSNSNFDSNKQSRYENDDGRKDTDANDATDNDKSFKQGDNVDDEKKSQDPPRRPVLNLKPRTKPADSKEEESTRSSAIFGAAKPVDTAAKEREIEQRLASTQEQSQKDDEDKPEEDKAHVRKQQREDDKVSDKRFDDSKRGYGGVRGRGRGGRGTGGRDRKEQRPLEPKKHEDPAQPPIGQESRFAALASDDGGEGEEENEGEEETKEQI